MKKPPDRKWADAPKKGSKQWIKNESIIAKNSYLRSQRDKVEGFKPSSGISTGVNDEQYKAGYDQINWGKKDPNIKPKFKIKINGVYVDGNNADD